MSWRRIKDIRNFFRQEKENEAIKYRILKDLKNLSEHEDEEVGNYYKPVRVTVVLKRKVTVIKIKHYQLNNILINLYHI